MSYIFQNCFSPNLENFSIVRSYEKFILVYFTIFYCTFPSENNRRPYFRLRCHKALSFSLIFDRFTTVRFWLNLWCSLITQLAIVHFCPELITEGWTFVCSILKSSEDYVKYAKPFGVKHDIYIPAINQVGIGQSEY